MLELLKPAYFRLLHFLVSTDLKLLPYTSSRLFSLRYPYCIWIYDSYLLFNKHLKNIIPTLTFIIYKFFCVYLLLWVKVLIWNKTCLLHQCVTSNLPVSNDNIFQCNLQHTELWNIFIFITSIKGVYNSKWLKFDIIFMRGHPQLDN